jgi:hypothetical protein
MSTMDPIGYFEAIWVKKRVLLIYTMYPSSKGRCFSSMTIDSEMLDLSKERPVNSPWPTPSSRELADADFDGAPWYWVAASEVDKRLETKQWTRN